MSAAGFGPEGFTVSCVHDGTPLTFKSAGWSWEGDYEVCRLRFECDCGLTAVVETREMDGGPEAVRARREREAP
jgi:hypothetical protein